MSYCQRSLKTALKHTCLFKKLVCELAYKWVTVLRVAVNKVDKRATVRVLRASVKIIDGIAVCRYLSLLPHKRSSYAFVVSTH